MKDEFNLEGKKALITGAGRGMGRSMALAMARHGADVVVAARTQSEVESVASEIKALGRRGFALPIDLMKLESIEPMVKRAAELLGGVDILVNNAGGSVATDPADLVKTLQENLTLNLVQVACMIQAALPYMIKQRWGRIINTGSGAATRAGMFAAYTASKHGLVGYTKTVAQALGRHGINVNVVNPGWTETVHMDWNKIGPVLNMDAASAKKYAEGLAIQGRIIEPDELAGVVVMLASEAGSAITGQVLDVDGGYRVGFPGNPLQG
jgi:NAD(P)-dependent dehydrogenase (short-subunit alcohol dehydrogenase family)